MTPITSEYHNRHRWQQLLRACQVFNTSFSTFCIPMETVSQHVITRSFN